jgi:hypothetical protein
VEVAGLAVAKLLLLLLLLLVVLLLALAALLMLGVAAPVLLPLSGASIWMGTLKPPLLVSLVPLLLPLLLLAGATSTWIGTVKSLLALTLSSLLLLLPFLSARASAMALYGLLLHSAPPVMVTTGTEKLPAATELAISVMLS